MYLDVVLIEFLTPDGILTSYRVLPKYENKKVVIDRLEDIFPDRLSDEEQDLGGTRIYNTSECVLDKIRSKIRNFKMKEERAEFAFQFEHMGIPVGSGNRGRGGIYNFVLPPGWQFKSIKVVDPYDNRHTDFRLKKEFRYRVVRDISCDTSMVDMTMHSGRGTFSFVILGHAVLSPAGLPIPSDVKIEESEYAINGLSDVRILDSNGKKRLSQELAERADWLELKPNIFGIGLNVNEIIRGLIEKFKKKVKS